MYCIQNYPGFGESEFFYSLTITVFSVGSIITSPMIGFLTLCVPYFFIFLTALLLHTASNLLYGLATDGWMILLSRFLLGISFKAIKVGTLTYICSKESDYIAAYIGSKKLNSETDEYKSTQMKKTALILVAISTYLPALIGPGV